MSLYTVRATPGPTKNVDSLRQCPSLPRCTRLRLLSQFKTLVSLFKTSFPSLDTIDVSFSGRLSHPCSATEVSFDWFDPFGNVKQRPLPNHSALSCCCKAPPGCSDIDTSLLLPLHTHTHTHTRTHARTHARTRTHAHTHTHTHTHTHRGSRTHQHVDYTKCNLHTT